MKFSSKTINRIKTKNYIKTTNFFGWFCGFQQNSTLQLETNQQLKTINFKSYKIHNIISKKIIKTSIYKNVFGSINSTTFFIKPTSNKILITKKLLFNINFFVFLMIKLNKNIYLVTHLKQIKSFNYSINKLVLYQFFLTNIKSNFFN